VNRATIDELLGKLAQKFESAVIRSDGDEWAWGQFLDSSRTTEQTGPYGTAAGVMVLALAGRGPSLYLRGGVKTLCKWWSEATSSSGSNGAYATERLTQTIRLSFAHQALRLAGTPEALETAEAMRVALLDRRLPDGHWGNYWISATDHDATPRVFASAVVLMALTLPRSLPPPVPTANLDALARGLAVQADSARDNSGNVLNACASATASLAVLGKSAKLSARSTNHLTRVLPLPLGDRSVYFFSHPNLKSPGQSRNGYFFISPHFLLALAGLQPGAPMRARLYAEDTVRALAKHLEARGAFQPNQDSPVASVDQAWAALLLASSERPIPLAQWAARPIYELVRYRKDNWFTEWVFPAWAVLSVTVLNIMLGFGNGNGNGDTDHLSLGGGIPSTLWHNVVGAVSVLLIGGTYASRVGRILRGRE